LPDAAVTTVERRRLTDDHLIEHQDDSALARNKPAF
jgi:hypothetical protein